MPALPKGHKANFDTLKRAFEAGHVALLDCRDKKTGKPVAVIVALQQEEDGEIGLVPFARLFDGNPYEELDPPDPKGGYRAG
jgi:hypothetical protein